MLICTYFVHTWLIPYIRSLKVTTIVTRLLRFLVCCFVSAKWSVIASWQVMISYIPFASESPNTPISTADILWVQVVQIPPQTSELVFAWFHKHVDFTFTFLGNPFPVSLHVPLGVTGAYDRDFCLQQLWYCCFPFRCWSWMTKTWMIKHETVKVRIVRIKHVCLM